MSTPSAYCEAADLYDHGLQRGAIANPGRYVADVSAASEVLSLDGHGFRLNAELLFRAEAGGTLPAPLVEGTTYYAIPLTDSTFQVAATEDGPAIDLTTAGSNILVVTPLPFAAVIRWASAMVDEMLPAHLVPLAVPYPETVIAVTAELAAAKMMAITGSASETSITDVMARAQRVLDRWARGVPIRGANVPKAASLSVARSASAADPRGWDNGGLIP